MNELSILQIKDEIKKGNRNVMFVSKYQKDILEIAKYKIIKTPFNGYDDKYNKDYPYNEDGFIRGECEEIINGKNYPTIIDTNDYVYYDRKINNFGKLISLVIRHLRTNCNYITINNEYERRELNPLIQWNILYPTTIQEVYIINHNFIHRSNDEFIKYFCTKFYQKKVNIISKNYTVNIKWNLDDILDKNKIKLSKCRITNKIFNRYLYFKVSDSDTDDKIVDKIINYGNYYNINLLDDNINFLVRH